MKFQITVIETEWNPYSHFLYDFAKLFCYSIESLGHDCSIVRNKFDLGRMNIVIAGHHLRDPKDVMDLRRSKVPYVVLQSEIIKGGLLNNVPGSKEFLDNVYLPLLQGARGVWDSIQVNKPELESLGIPARFYRGGYHPAMEEVVHKRDKDIDFLFVGSMTPHRREMLKALVERGYQVTTEFDAKAIYRNDLIARTKVNLAPRQSDQMNHLPWSRITYLLNNRSLVVGENCLDQEWLEHCFPHADTDKWGDLCIKMLERPDREEFALVCYERFRTLPMTEQVEPLLEGLATSRPRSMKSASVVWSGPLLESSPEAAESRQFVFGLDRLGVLIKTNPIEWDGCAADLAPEESQAINRLAQVPAAPCFIHLQYLSSNLQPKGNTTNGARINIGRTTFGTDRIPTDWVPRCNAMDEIWVPSEFNIETFAWSGVERRKLHKVPVAIAVDQFGNNLEPLPLPVKRGFQFLSVFDWTLRKGWDVLLRAYIEEFDAREDICLFLKIHSSARLTEPQILERVQAYIKEALGRDPERIPDVVLLQQPLEQDQMPRLYRAVDTYVMPSRGEGWGHAYLEAMATGLPVIGTNWSGNTEFMNKENSYPIDYTLVDVPDAVVAETAHLQGHRWAEPSVQHLRLLMRTVFENREEGRYKGQAAREYIAANFSRERVVQHIKERLEVIAR